jgi:hypothetical protein
MPQVTAEATGSELRVQLYHPESALMATLVSCLHTQFYAYDG